DPREQLAEAEGLHDVVVRAELEPDDAVDLLALRADHDDRDVRAAPKLAANGEAVEVGQRQVEQDEIGLARLERRPACPDALDREAFPPKSFGERLRDRILVLDDQDLHDPEARSVGARPDPGEAVPAIRDSPEPDGRARPARGTRIR